MRTQKGVRNVSEEVEGLLGMWDVNLEWKKGPAPSYSRVCLPYEHEIFAGILHPHWSLPLSPSFVPCNSDQDSQLCSVPLLSLHLHCNLSARTKLLFLVVLLFDTTFWAHSLHSISGGSDSVFEAFDWLPWEDQSTALIAEAWCSCCILPQLAETCSLWRFFQHWWDLFGMHAVGDHFARDCPEGGKGKGKSKSKADSSEIHFPLCHNLQVARCLDNCFSELFRV